MENKPWYLLTHATFGVPITPHHIERVSLWFLKNIFEMLMWKIYCSCNLNFNKWLKTEACISIENKTPKKKTNTIILSKSLIYILPFSTHSLTMQNITHRGNYIPSWNGIIIIVFLHSFTSSLAQLHSRSGDLIASTFQKDALRINLD